MNHEEAKSIVINEIQSRWGHWKPSDQLVEDFIFAIKDFDDPNDVLNGIKRYRNGCRLKEPRVCDLMENINAVIADRRKRERRERGEWPGQVFLVVHHKETGEADAFWDWHIPNEKAEVPYEKQVSVLDRHLRYVKGMWGDYPQYKFGNFCGEIHTEASAVKRMWEVYVANATPEEKARLSEIEERIFNGEPAVKIFREMFKVIAEKVQPPKRPHRNYRASAPLLKPSDNGSAMTEKSIERDWTSGMVFDEHENIVNPVVQEHQETKPAKPKFDPPSWLDDDLKF